ncbi:MAG: MFS transporter [Candidatus Kapaibacteriales bacterium]
MKFLTRRVVVLSLVSFFTDVASEMLYPIIPLYLKSIGFSIMFIGILEGIAEFFAGFSKGYFGQLSDKVQKRTLFIRIGYVLSSLSKLMMGLIVQPLWFFFARTLDRFGKGIRTSARDALLSDESQPENRGKVFGFHRSLDTAGAVIGPLLALSYLHFFPEKYRYLFLLSFFPGIIVIILVFLIKDRKRERHHNPQKIQIWSFLSYFVNSPIPYRKLTIPFLIFMLFNSSDFFLLLKLKELQIDDTKIIWFYICYNISYAFFSYPIGKIADKIGLRKILAFGLFSFAIVYFFINILKEIHWLMLIFLVYGLYYASTEGIIKALIANLVPMEQTATALGTFNAFASTAILLASAFAGIVWNFYGSTFTLVLSSFVSFVIFLYLAFFN